MPPPYYRGCWHGVSRGLFARYRPKSFLAKGVYEPRSFILHAASLPQGFPHWARFQTAATRRCVGRVSVPLGGIILSDPLAVVGLVSRYLTNYLMAHKSLPKRKTFSHKEMPLRDHIRYYPAFRLYIPGFGARCLCLTPPFATRDCSLVRLACLRHAASVRPEP